jgi:hypothetical protein
MPRGVGVYLGPVQGHRPKLQQLHLLRDAEHLDEQRLNLLEESLAEPAQRIVIRVGIGREVAKCQGIVRCLLDTSARIGPRGVAVDEQRQEHRWMIGRRPRAAVSTNQCREVQLIDDVRHETRQVVFRQPVIERGRQEVRRVTITGTEMVHGRVLVGTLTDPDRPALEKFHAN